MHKKLTSIILCISLVVILLVTIGCKTTTTGNTTTSSTPTTTAVTTTNTTTTSVSTTAATTTATTAAAGTKTDFEGINYVPYTGRWDGKFEYPLIIPLSGSAAAYGIANMRAVQYASDHLNGQGGVVVDGKHYKITPVFWDSKYQAADVATLTDRAVSLGYKYMSLMGQALTLTMYQKTVANNIFFIANALPNHAFINTSCPLIFDSTLGTSDLGPATYYPEFVKEFGVKNMVLVDPDNDSGRLYSGVCQQVIKDYGLPMTVISDQYYTPGTQDFSPLVNKIMSLHPDMVDCPGAVAGDFALFMKQLGEAGFKGVRCESVSLVDPTVGWQIAGSYSTGCFNIGFAGMDPSPLYTTAQAQYVKDYGEKPFSGFFYYYELTCYYLCKAITQSNSFDPYRVAATLQDMTWSGMYGSGSKFIGDDPGSPWGLKRIWIVQQPMSQWTTNGNATVWKNVAPITR
ncbi:MAG TPA: ABC transporter substrate-binding protein [Dehalococcoidales bacterium]|nr:ABC transporter substrate-binding protein [Dehalococcoidales bacterium]